MKLVSGSDYYCYCCNTFVAVTAESNKPQWAECGLISWTVRLPRTLEEKGKLRHTGNLVSCSSTHDTDSFPSFSDKAPQIGDLHTIVYCLTVLEFNSERSLQNWILLCLSSWLVYGHFLPLTLYSLPSVHNCVLIFFYISPVRLGATLRILFLFNYLEVICYMTPVQSY
jgi:hypothetical protein